jgi:hypothetical protein
MFVNNSTITWRGLALFLGGWDVGAAFWEKKKKQDSDDWEPAQLFFRAK